MTEIKIFEREEFGSIRTAEVEGKILFCGKDVASALGYSNYRDALNKHCLEEGVVKCDTPTNGGNQQLTYITEGNLYRLITHSKLESAQKFESWVFDEVLPAIRRTGSYSVTPSIPEAELKLREDENRLKKAELIERFADKSTVQTYKDICTALAVNIVADGNYLPLPRVKEKTYKASELAEEFGVSIQMFGTLANRNSVKNADNGEIIWDLGKNGKQVENFVYYESGKEKMRKICTEYKLSKEGK